MKSFVRAFLIFLLLGTLFLTSCASGRVLERPEDTSLEFWIAEKVSTEDFEGHYRVDDAFGCYLYYGKGYQPVESEEGGGPVQPEHCVKYTITAYPDYSSNQGNFDTVTRIEITDPKVSVYGITCRSSLTEFDRVFTDLECESQDKGIIHIARIGKTNISFADYGESAVLTVWVEVTNRQGIDF